LNHDIGLRKLAIVYRTELPPETVVRPEFLEGEGPVEGFRLKMERFGLEPMGCSLK
jgi:hypothetical protein